MASAVPTSQDEPAAAVALSAIDCDGWVLKKPTAQNAKSWASSSLQKRFLESRGYHIAYYADEASRRPKGQKPRGTFDLRDVSMLRESVDPTAPSSALELVVKKHAFTISFQSEKARDGFLAVWINGVPPTAVPQPLMERFHSKAIVDELAATGGEGGAPGDLARRLTTRGSMLGVAASEGETTPPQAAGSEAAAPGQQPRDPPPASGDAVPPPLAPTAAAPGAGGGGGIGGGDALPLMRDGWMDLPRKEGAALGQPVFVHCEGYLLSWYAKKPMHGELAKPLKALDLRELILLDLGGEGGSGGGSGGSGSGSGSDGGAATTLRLKAPDGLHELKATSAEDATLWLAHLAAASPQPALCDAARRLRDPALSAALADSYATQPTPRKSFFGQPRRSQFEAAPKAAAAAAVPAAIPEGGAGSGLDAAAAAEESEAMAAAEAMAPSEAMAAAAAMAPRRQWRRRRRPSRRRRRPRRRRRHSGRGRPRQQRPRRRRALGRWSRPPRPPRPRRRRRHGWRR